MTAIRRSFISMDMIIIENFKDGKELAEWIMRGKADPMIRKAIAEYLLSTGFIPEDMSDKSILVIDSRETESSVTIRCVFHPEYESFEFSSRQVHELLNIPCDLNLSIDIPSSNVKERLLEIMEALESDEDYEYLHIEHIKEPVILKYI